MKRLAVVSLLLLASFPAPAQDRVACKAYFQVLHGQAGTPGFHAGLDAAQKRWWETEGQKKYPGLCLESAVAAGDTPRFVVVWMTAKTAGGGSLAAGDAYGLSAAALQSAVKAEKIYQSRWNLSQVTVINVLGDDSLLLPPVYFETEDRFWDLFGPDTPKVLKNAVKYLWYERVFLPNPS